MPRVQGLMKLPSVSAPLPTMHSPTSWSLHRGSRHRTVRLPHTEIYQKLSLNVYASKDIELWYRASFYVFICSMDESLTRTKYAIKSWVNTKQSKYYVWKWAIGTWWTCYGWTEASWVEAPAFNLTRTRHPEFWSWTSRWLSYFYSTEKHSPMVFLLNTFAEADSLVRTLNCNW